MRKSTKQKEKLICSHASFGENEERKEMKGKQVNSILLSLCNLPACLSFLLKNKK
jgi:hypothetical protein